MMFVRTVSSRDLPAVRALLVEAWRDAYDRILGVEKVTEVNERQNSIAALKALLDAPRSEFIVADDGERIAGVAFAKADETGEEAQLCQLYVLPGMQGRGVGGLLIEEIEDSFPEARRFVLEVESANERAIRFYQSHGYVDAGPIAPSADSRQVCGQARRMLKSRQEFTA